MTRKKTRRKHWPLMNVIDVAIKGAAITEDAALNKLRLRELAAIENFAQGKAGRGDWQDLVNVLNLCETMAQAGIGPEALEACEAAQEALHEAALRYEQMARMSITDTGLQALRDLYEYADLQRSSISRSEYESMIRATVHRIQAIKSGNVRDVVMI